ncbi:hypothetical protein GVN21_16680 [Caulobacter sp. SLTY]|uniref:hypothetical protein n=1 Tax=Caulobacter sp. SLTY TaxID=2683262 RepID=UPI001411E21B|nr:hypothetical protein [Caulobacter sp. SLTY]NBB17003.1 hypothetical protein [Caulobacter sp. SLTY]
MRGEKAIKRLKQAISPDPSQEVQDGAWEELSGESDRATIILAATMVEDRLKAVLQARMAHLTNDQRDRLFAFNGPLGAFSAMIDIAYGFELIRREERDSAHIVRELRNAAAHSRKPITFAMPEVWDVVSALIGDSANSVGGKIERKAVFIVVCGSVAIAIEDGPDAAAVILRKLIDQVRRESMAPTIQPTALEQIKNIR